MRILIVGATLIETEYLCSKLKKIKDNDKNERLTHYSFRNHEVDLLITGVGMTATAFYLGKIFVEEDYDYAINMGLAGSYDKDSQLGEVVRVIVDSFSEMGVLAEDDFHSLHKLSLINKDDFPFRDGYLVNEQSPSLPSINKLKEVKGITVNTINGNTKRIDWVRKIFFPDVESMEGAAFLFACIIEGVSCAQIRSISNYVEGYNKHKWNMSEAIENVNLAVLEILADIDEQQ